MSGKITDDDLRRLWAKHAPNIGGTLDYAREVYALARKEALSDAALCAAIHCQYPVETDFDRGYGKGSRDASDRIRALMNKGA